jgi:hypothetical protein
MSLLLLKMFPRDHGLLIFLGDLFMHSIWFLQRRRLYVGMQRERKVRETETNAKHTLLGKGLNETKTLGPFSLGIRALHCKGGRFDLVQIAYATQGCNNRSGTTVSNMYVNNVHKLNLDNENKDNIV